MYIIEASNNNDNYIIKLNVNDDEIYYQKKAANNNLALPIYHIFNFNDKKGIIMKKLDSTAIELINSTNNLHEKNIIIANIILLLKKLHNINIIMTCTLIILCMIKN